MRTDRGSLMRMMVVSMSVLLACACAGMAQEKKPADPFVKGAKPPVKTAEMPAPSAQEQPIVPGMVRASKPRTVTEKDTAGEGTTESPIEVMKRIIIPEISFQHASLLHVVAFLGKASAEFDEEKRGVNFILDLKDARPQPITFNARQISLLDALNLCMGVAGLQYRIEGNVVRIGPGKNGSDEAPASEPFADARPGASGQNLEIEVQFVAFDITNVEKLVASGGLNMDSLTKLWIGGAGRLLAAPRVVTPAGAEAVVKGVTECVYPTTFTVTTGEKAGDTTSGETTGTNTSAAITKNTAVARGPVVEPGGFQTREVGVILQVIPEVREDGIIALTLSPQLVEEPIWHDYGSKYLDSNGKEQQARMEQPFFQVYSLSASIAVVNGQRTLIGGGTLSRDRKQMVFIFVTARKVGIRGETIK